MIKMKNMMIDGQIFVGPYILGQDPIPAEPGLALVCTEAGEGVKIMSIEEAADLRKEIEESDRVPMWKEKAYLGRVDVFVMLTDMSSEEREKLQDSLIYKRRDSLNCQKPKVIEDDW